MDDVVWVMISDGCGNGGALAQVLPFLRGNLQWCWRKEVVD